MAMTKKERHAFDAAIKAARLNGALRWTAHVEPDLMPPEGMGLVKGWLPNQSGSVSKACTSSSYHCPYSDEKTTSQRPMRLYSTRLLALRAARHMVELRAANELATVDLQIEMEMQEPT